MSQSRWTPPPGPLDSQEAPGRAGLGAVSRLLGPAQDVGARWRPPTKRGGSWSPVRAPAASGAAIDPLMTRSGSRPTVMDLVRAKGRVYPVGRLDVDTQGLVLLTSHGALAHRMTHPRYRVPRLYVAEVRGVPNEAALRRLARGVRLEDGLARATAVRIRRRSTRRAHLEITMTEGRKHEVRRMMEAVGHPVLDLVRVGFGSLRLGRLRTGEWRPLTSAEVGKLLAEVGL